VCYPREGNQTEIMVNYGKGFFVRVFSGVFQGTILQTGALLGRTARVETKMGVFTFSQTFEQKNFFAEITCKYVRK
jgi:hypothetical protein